MIIHSPKISESNGKAIISADIESASRMEVLWYSVDAKYGKFLTPEKLDGFVVAVLPLAMKYGEDLQIEGAMSEKLFYHLSNYYIPIYKSLIPTLHHVRLVPERVDSGHGFTCEGRVVTGFSGGIDSFAVLADHLFGDSPPAFKITDLVFNNVGSSGSRELFQSRYAKLVNFSDEMQLDFVRIDSNLREFLGRDPLINDFCLTHVPRNVSAILMLQKLFSKYLYASGIKYKDCFVGATYDIAYTDPFAIHLLSTETLDCISTGCQYSRVQKTERVTEIEPSWRYLNVCARNMEKAGNCSTCWKCARTLLTLEILGKEDLYSTIFDLPAYRKIRDRYIRATLLSRDALQREIVDLAKEREFQFSITQKVYSSMPVRVLRDNVPKSFRNAAKRLVGIPDYPNTD